MKVGPPNLFDALGFSAQGDLGPYTCYQSKRRQLVVYAKAPPKEPPSTKQLWERAKWKAAASLWRTSTPAIRAAWTLAARRAHLTITGHNLFIFFYTTNRAAIIRTIQSQTGINLIS